MMVSELSDRVALEGIAVQITDADYQNAGLYACEAVNEYTAGGKTSKPLIVIERMLDVKSRCSSLSSAAFSVNQINTEMHRVGAWRSNFDWWWAENVTLPCIKITVKSFLAEWMAIFWLLKQYNRFWNTLMFQKTIIFVFTVFGTGNFLKQKLSQPSHLSNLVWKTSMLIWKMFSASFEERPVWHKLEWINIQCD